MPQNVLPTAILEQVTNALHTGTGISCAILTTEGEIVAQSGHQRICTQFHRQHPDTRQNCQRYSRRTQLRIAKSHKCHLLQCPHGLVDIAAPIVVEGDHVANVFLGPFLLETVDRRTRDQFRRQAERYGFDQEAYLEALHAVPVFAEDKIKPLAVCLSDTAELIAQMSLDHIRSEHLMASLKEREKQYRLVADFTYDCEYWISPEGQFLYVSPSCQRITGHPPEAFIENPDLFFDLIHPADRASVEHHLRNEIHAPGHAQLDFRIIDKQGNIKWISHFCQSVHEDDGTWRGRRGSNRDITDRKRIEAELIAHEKELREKSARLEKANQALKASLDHREAEKEAIEANIYNHIEKMIRPYIESALQGRLDPVATSNLELAAANLNAMLQGSTPLFNHYLALSPTEIKVAELVRQGQRTKQIAATLHLAPSSVASCRKSIRRKLGLANTKINLRAYLASLNP